MHSAMMFRALRTTPLRERHATTLPQTFSNSGGAKAWAQCAPMLAPRRLRAAATWSMRLRRWISNLRWLASSGACHPLPTATPASTRSPPRRAIATVEPHPSPPQLPGVRADPALGPQVQLVPVVAVAGLVGIDEHQINGCRCGGARERPECLFRTNHPVAIVLH